MGLETVSSKKNDKDDLKVKPNEDGKAVALASRVFHSGQSQLLETSHEYWSDPSTTQNDRKAYIDVLKASYQSLLDEFLATADACVDRTNSLEKVNKKWRWAIILGTGVVAIVNILAANVVTLQRGDGETSHIAASIISITAAVVAAILAVLTNLENFAGAQRRAQGVSSGTREISGFLSGIRAIMEYACKCFLPQSRSLHECDYSDSYVG